MRRKVIAAGVTVGAPSAIVVAVGVLLAAAQFLAQLLLTSGVDLQWRDIIAVGIQAFVTLGLPPIYGPALVTLLHIPARILLAIGLLLTAGNGVLTVVRLDHVLHVVLATALTVIGVLLGVSNAEPAPHARRASPVG